MTTLRSIVALRSLLLSSKSYRISFRAVPSMVSCPSIPVRIEQSRSFSSSVIVHARRRDKIDGTIKGDSNNEEEEEEEANDEDNDDSEQVRWLPNYSTITDSPIDSLSSRLNKRKSKIVFNSTNYQKVEINVINLYREMIFYVGYRIIIRHIASLRLDLVCAAGTGIGRR